MKILYLVSVLLIIILIKNYYNKNLEYYSQIINNSKISDFTRWILTDKYVGKKYAELFGFKIPKTYQLIKYPQDIKFRKTCVIKPVDLCDSKGVYLIKENINLKTNKIINKNLIIKELQEIRSKIFDEYYIHENMYNGLIPFGGYIVEELLLNNNNQIPSDYKCYVFNGRIYYIACTFNRKIINNKQVFNSIWLNRQGEPIYFPMIKKGYKYDKNFKIPNGFNKMINLVENLGKNLKRHCRIDVYIINNDIYFSEFTFFCGARLHTSYCNFILGYLWFKYPDNYSYYDKKIDQLIPPFYNKP